jgi:adenosylcobyric acid synthase
LSRIANFDDLDPLKMHPGVRLQMVRPGQAIPGDAAVVIIPGTKSTRADLAFLQEQGWDIDLKAHHRRGGRILGICGGFQMLGCSIADPHGIEGEAGETEGLGYLDVKTVLAADKRLTRVTAVHALSGLQVTGYEIHLGQTDGPDCMRPFAHVGDLTDGARSNDGRVEGTYLHGLLTSDAFRSAWLQGLGARTSNYSYAAKVDDVLDQLAAHLEAHLDVEALFGLAQ